MEKKSKNEIKQEVLANLVRSSYPILVKGGQHAGISPGVSVYSPDLDVKIEINHYRSQHKNSELAYVLINLVIDEVIK